MPNPNYKKGAAAEYYMKRVLESVGYVVTRAAGSHGTFDLVALGKADVVAVQSKRGLKAPPMSEWQAAVDADLAETIVRMVVWIPETHVSGRLQPRVLWCSHAALPWWCAHVGWQEGLPPVQPRLRLRS